MEPLHVAFLTLAALLTGALLPLIFQVRATLRSVQRSLDTTGPRLAQTLAEVTAATQDFNVVAKEMAATLGQFRGTVQTVSAIGSAVGPAIAAAVLAFKTIRADEACKSRAESSETDSELGGQSVS